MNITRRTFLRAGAATAAAGLALLPFHQAFAQSQSVFGRPEKDPHTGLFRLPHEVRDEPALRFSLSTFSPYVGGVFKIFDDIGSPREMTLVKVTDTRTAAQKAPGETAECFTLTFSAGRDFEPFPQGTRQVEHGALGKFELFLVPTTTGEGVFYEAVINHTGPLTTPDKNRGRPTEVPPDRP